MKKFLLILLFLTAVYTGKVYPCNVCGGGTGDFVILALDGRALFNAGLFYDSYRGEWDKVGVWHKYPDNYTQNQYRVSISGAYRFNRHLQAAVSIPYVKNYSNVPGLPTDGSGLGDISLSGRYEFFHEFQLKKKNNKDYIDRTLPYLAVSFGLTLPTGVSDETAESSVDITGKGYFVSSLGVSVTKTIIKNRLQLSTDLSWQHSFKKTYKSYFNEPLSTSFEKQQGDKFNYALAVNYIFNSWHAFSLAVTGSNQTANSYNRVTTDLSEERSMNFMATYTYYPTVAFRITPSVKWTLPQDDWGKNSSGSTTFGLNLTYYFADYNIK